MVSLCNNVAGVDELDSAWTLFTKNDFEPPVMSTEDIIGTGGYSKVYKMKMKSNGAEVAGKKFHNFTEANHRELDMLKKLNHQNVVKLHGHINDRHADDFVIIMEKADGSLRQYLKGNVDAYNNKPCEPRLLSKWMREVCDAIQYLHGRDPPVIHRDIRGANCLLFGGRDYRLKLADFGLSKETDHTTGT